jgi:uncharacterized protein YbjT (DUF2867 family)
MSQKVPVFLIGATGYIGGSVLSGLLALSLPSITLDITALVRDREKAVRLKNEFGVNTVVGSYQELHKLERLASEAEYVIACVRLCCQLRVLGQSTG